MSQTGGCCRASNYIAFIRRALDKVGLSHIPVISLNANGMEQNSGFVLKPGMLIDALKALILGDLIMRCLYRVRPYEVEEGSANRLHDHWRQVISDQILGIGKHKSFKSMCQGIVKDFDELPIYEDMKKPRVGIVGEILVKYMPLANNFLVDLLEKEGAEAVVPDLTTF